MSDPVVVAHLDEITTLEPGEGVPGWKPVRRHLDVRAFGVNAWVSAQVGDIAIEEHDELNEDGTPGPEELYVVLRGATRFTVGGEEIDAPAGTLVFVRDPAATRGAVATAPDTIVLAIGADRGVAFEPSEWEARWLKELGVA